MTKFNLANAKRLAIMAGRIAFFAALLTPILIGLATLFRMLVGIDLGTHFVTSAVPIAIVLEVAGAKREGRRSIVLGRMELACRGRTLAR